jgi:MFS family permease
MKLAILGGAAVAVAFLLPGLVVGPSFDAAVFTEVSRRVADGALPYAGVWDHKPPGLYILGAAAQAVLRWVDPWTVMWLLGLVTVVAAATCTALMLRRLGHANVAWVGAVITAGVATTFVISLGGGLTEPMACLPLAAALLVAVSSPPEWRRTAVVGVLLGLALLMSLLAAPGILAIALFPAFRTPRSRLVIQVGALLLGVVAPLAVVFGTLGLLGAGTAAFDALLTYGAVYRQVNLTYVRLNEHASAAAATLTLLVVLIPGLLGVMRGFRLAAPWPALSRLALVWGAGTIAAAIYLGRFETHYAAPLAIPLGLFAPLGLADIARRARRSAAVAAVMVPVLIIGAVISIVVTVANIVEHGRAIAAENERTAAVGRYLGDHSPTGATVFVWGNEPQLYYLADRTPATRFIYMLPLTTPGYVTSAMIDATRTQFQANPPALIVDVGSLEPGSPGDPPLLINRPLRNGDGRSYDILGRLRDFVKEHYSLLEVVDGWPVYRLMAPTS